MIESLLSEMVAALLPGVLWKNRSDSLVAAVVGLILCGKAKMWEMGMMAPGRAKPVNRGKRVWRFVNNPHVIVEQIAAGMIAVLTRGVKFVIVAIDWTDLGPWKVLQVAIVTGSRGIPVYWKVVNESKKRLAEAELELLESLVLRLVPLDKNLIVIGDRGFDSAHIVRFLRQHHVKFVLRFSHGIGLRLKGGDFDLVETIPLQREEIADYGRVEYTISSAVPVRVVRVWKNDQNEEWNLVTNLGANVTAELVVKLYARRFTIEELFRDYKGGDWGAGSTTIQTEERMERFLSILALAHIIQVKVGLSAKAHGLERKFRSTEGLSPFKLGERILQTSEREQTPVPWDVCGQEFDSMPIELEAILNIPWRTRSGSRRKMDRREADPIHNECFRLYLADQNLTQRQMAQLIGCKQPTVSVVATGKCPMPLAWLPKLLEHAQMTYEQFCSLPHRVTETKKAVVHPATAKPIASRQKEPSSPGTQPTPPPLEHFRLSLQTLWRQVKQRDLATAVGVSQATVSRVIAAKQPFRLAWVPRLCEAFGMAESQFLKLGQVHVAQPRNTAPTWRSG